MSEARQPKTGRRGSWRSRTSRGSEGEARCGDLGFPSSSLGARHGHAFAYSAGAGPRPEALECQCRSERNWASRRRVARALWSCGRCVGCRSSRSTGDDCFKAASRVFRTVCVHRLTDASTRCVGKWDISGLHGGGRWARSLLPRPWILGIPGQREFRRGVLSAFLHHIPRLAITRSVSSGSKWILQTSVSCYAKAGRLQRSDPDRQRDW
jgi:hypothetical protein